MSLLMNQIVFVMSLMLWWDGLEGFMVCVFLCCCMLEIDARNNVEMHAIYNMEYNLISKLARRSVCYEFFQLFN